MPIRIRLLSEPLIFDHIPQSKNKPTVNAIVQIKNNAFTIIDKIVIVKLMDNAVFAQFQMNSIINLHSTRNLIFTVIDINFAAIGKLVSCTIQILPITTNYPNLYR